jgi:multimeric flavodoxin WrbA
VSIQQDDMVKLNEQLEASELWVLGTPVYMWGPTAQFKIFIDRWYGLKPVFFEGKSAILTVPFQGRHENFARYLVGMVSAVLSDLKIELLGTLLVPGITTKGAVRVKRDVLAEARRMGREAIQLLS